MINEKATKKGNIIFSEEKEVSILKHYSQPKSSLLNSNKDILYSDPPEVILQSKNIFFNSK